MELKPCPFCGGGVVRDHVNDEYHSDISCTGCEESFRMSDEDWNTRDDESIRREVFHECLKEINAAIEWGDLDPLSIRDRVSALAEVSDE